MNILLIGCGNIGSALLNLWVEYKLFTKIVVVQPSLGQAKHFENHPAVFFTQSLTAIPQNFDEDVTVLAVKPQQFNEVATLLKARKKGLVLSSLTGITLEQLSSALEDQKVIRFMPNVAIKTGKSTNLAIATEGVDSKDKTQFEKILSPAGVIIWLEKESHLDNLTAISGSGPAFFFLLAELLRLETIKMGIDEAQALQIIEGLFTGSASLAKVNSNYEALIDSVTSKKGITAAALAIMRPEMAETLKKSIHAARVRVKELSDERGKSCG